MPAQPLNLPKPPALHKILGPSFILLGLALGSGELILWPYLSAQYGLGLIWGALLGVTLQYVLNTEVMRYTLYWGESVFVGFRRMNRGITFWYILSTFIPWSIPGFSSATAEILHTLVPWVPKTPLAVALLLLTGIILSSGKSVYHTIERFQKVIIFVGMPFFAILTVWLADGSDWSALGAGLLGRGEGWMFFPPGVAIGSFLAAFAYSGAGGNLNLAQSYYIKEKGFGMGAYMGKITGLFSGKPQEIKLTGQTFAQTPANLTLWKKWWSLIAVEHALVFWLLSIVCISLLAVLAHATVYGQDISSGISFLFAQSAVITERTSSVIGLTFLLVSATTLFSTQLGVMESSARIISENIILLGSNQHKKVNASYYFYTALWAQIILGAVIYLSGFQEPRLLLTLSALCNAAAMMLSFPLVYFLNRRRLAPAYQPRSWRVVVIVIAVLFFGYLLLETLRS